jgi:hypothetical protein
MSHNNDPLTLIQRANPVLDAEQLPDGPDSLTAQAMLEDIVTMPTQSSRRSNRRVVLLAAAGLAVLTTAAAWAYVTQPEQSTEIQCAHSLIMPAVSGDPVADCAAELDRLGIEHGALSAYVNKFGGVGVYEIGTDVPPSYQPLDEDFRQDVAIIDLERALSDVTTGLEADCYSTDEAVPIIERELDRVGIEWAIGIGLDTDGRERIADGRSTCAYAIPTPEELQVTLISLDAPGSGVGEELGEPPWTAPSEQLHQRLADECLTLDEAAMIARELFSPLAQEWLADGNIKDQDESYVIPITRTVDTGAACTRATVTVGGTVFIDLRGPTG